MERFVERDELRPRLALRVPVAARELQARFHRFRTAVAEERALQSRQGREALGHFTLIRVVKEVGRVDERLRLIGQRTCEAGMGMTERGDADPGQEVEIFAPVRVVEPHAVAANEGNRIAAIGLQHVQGFPGHHVVHNRRHPALLLVRHDPA